MGVGGRGGCEKKNHNSVVLNERVTTLSRLIYKEDHPQASLYRSMGVLVGLQKKETVKFILKRLLVGMDGTSAHFC